MSPCYNYANAFVGQSYGFAVSWMSIQVAILCTFGIVVLFVALLRTLREELFPLYLGYLLFTAFAFTVQAIQQFFPKTEVEPYHGVTECILALTIAMQWFVHTSTVIYLLERNPGLLPRRVILYAGFFSVCLLTIWTSGVVFGRLGYAELVVELLLVVFFGGTVVLQSETVRKCLNFRSQFYLRGRPAMVLWCTFEIVAHSYFAVMYALRDLMGADNEVGWCLYVVGDSIYYLVYPFVLVAVVRMDSKYWKQSGALLNDMRTVLEREEDRLLSSGDGQIVAVGDFPLVPWSQLDFREKLGSGGYSVVYKALWKGALVAVKVFRASSSQLDTMNELIKEARMLQGLRHENICSLLGIAMRGQLRSDEDNTLFSHEDELSPNDVLLCAVLQYCAGGSLFQALHKREHGELSTQALFRIICDIGTGMEYLHSKGLMHRDLKTPNILLDENHRAIISDFGLARGGINPTSSTGVTMTAIGTPHYMAPELLRGERCTLKSDVWSFGVIVWECITRTVPYSGMNPILLMQQVAHEGLKPKLDPLRVDPLVPQVLISLYDACLASDAAERPTFEEISTQLRGEKKAAWL